MSYASDRLREGFCRCGCGQQTPLARKTDTKRGIRRGQPNLYIYGHAGARVRSERRCTWQGCDNSHTALGLCTMHYQRQRNGHLMDGGPRYRRRHPVIAGHRQCGRCEEVRPVQDYRAGNAYIEGAWMTGQGLLIVALFLSSATVVAAAIYLIVQALS